jgi:hypothetical protein
MEAIASAGYLLYKLDTSINSSGPVSRYGPQRKSDREEEEGKDGSGTILARKVSTGYWEPDREEMGSRFRASNPPLEGGLNPPDQASTT